MISNWRQNVFEHIVLCMFSVYRTLYFSDWQHNTIDPVVLWITIVMKKYELPWMQWETINPSGAESSEYKCVFLFQIILPLNTLWLVTPYGDRSGWMAQVTACCQGITQNNVRLSMKSIGI